jgi:hypothetical protein
LLLYDVSDKLENDRAKVASYESWIIVAYTPRCQYGAIPTSSWNEADNPDKPGARKKFGVTMLHELGSLLPESSLHPEFRLK